jgi:Phage Mu protein F like protein
MVVALRTPFEKQAKAQVDKQAKKEKAKIKSAFNAGSIEAVKRSIDSYYKGEAKKEWTELYRTIWIDTGNATIKFMEDHLTAPQKALDFTNIYAASYSYEKAYGPSFWIDHVTNFIKNQGKNRIKNVLDTTYHKIMGDISDGMEAGDGLPEIGTRVEEHLDETWPSRGTSIAITETVGACNSASLEETNQIAPNMLKEWITVGDDKVRPAHEDAGAQYTENPIPLDEPFDVGGEEMMFPGDPEASIENVINCRCCIGYAEAKE